MHTGVLNLYHSMPAPLRSLAAGARGLYLRTVRYGETSERAAREALERDHWPLERLRSYQEDRLSQILERAATQVPYYREQWALRRARGDRASWRRLENWPILEKDLVRRQPQAFVADDCERRRLYREQTSGTTGTPLAIWWSRATIQTWYGLAEARWRRWYGVSRADRWAILGGQLVTSATATRPPYWVWNAPLHQLYLSSYHLSAASIPSYLDALERYRIRYLFGYTSSLHSLAQGARESGRRLPMAVAITNAEPVFDYQRRTIADSFDCPVRETYGMAETVAAASECEAGQRHLWPEAGLVEVLRGETPVGSDEVGDLVATGLLNRDMPLIRYRTGDRAALGTQAPCACGRTLPRIAAIEGRADDLVIARDGRCVGRLDPVFKDELALREAQIIQERLDHLRILCVPAPGYRPELERALIQRVKDRVGDMVVTVERVNEIPRSANGKFRAVISRLPPEVVERARSGRSTHA